MEDKKYGTYYGEKLLPVDKNTELTFCGMSETGEFIDELHKAGVKETLFDYCEGERYSDTLFFEVDKNTDMNKVIVLVTRLRPDEFDEITPNCFRMWFD